MVKFFLNMHIAFLLGSRDVQQLPKPESYPIVGKRLLFSGLGTNWAGRVKKVVYFPSKTLAKITTLDATAQSTLVKGKSNLVKPWLFYDDISCQKEVNRVLWEAHAKLIGGNARVDDTTHKILLASPWRSKLFEDATKHVDHYDACLLIGQTWCHNTPTLQQGEFEKWG
eukprot:Gb_37514 [translate_table: standard]